MNPGDENHLKSVFKHEMVLNHLREHCRAYAPKHLQFLVPQERKNEVPGKSENCF